MLFLTVFLTYGYFYQSGQDNENARISQVYAIVEHGRLDVRGTNSADVVRYGDALYPNKAPGTSFVGVPSWWLFSQVFRAFDLPEALEKNLIFHLTVWTSIGLLSSLLTLLLYRILEDQLKSSVLALLLALAYALGTIAFPFSTIFFSHQLAAALVFISFGLLYLYKERNEGNLEAASARFGSPLMLALAGFCSGYALATEYPAVLAVAPISLYALRVVPRKSLAFFIVGGALGGGTLILYNLLAFGKLYMIPYSVYAGTGKFDDHEIGYMGVGIPSWDVLMEITFLPMRGLFVVNPWLVLVIPALLLLLFSRRHRRTYLKEKLVCAAVVVMFFAFNSAYGQSYVFWGGGASVGPRHIIPMLPFAVLLLAPLTKHRFARYFFYASGLVSVAIMLMATATEPRVPYAYHNPVVDLFWDGYVRGRLATHYDGPFSSLLTTDNSVSFNLGKLIGLAPRFQLLPLFVFWFVMVIKLSSPAGWSSRGPQRRIEDEAGGEATAFPAL